MNSASGSTNRLMSHGHAMRSIFGCSRVIHLSRMDPDYAGSEGSAYHADAAFEIGRVKAGLKGASATPWLTSWPCTQ